MNDMRALRVSTALGPTLRYYLTAVIPDLAPTDLVGLGADYPDELDRYLTLPVPPPRRPRRRRQGGRPGGPRVSESGARRLGVGRALLAQPAHRRRRHRSLPDHAAHRAVPAAVLRLLARPPASDYSSPYAAFLFDTRAGYCQHFAGAMALLLRYNGIPSRVAVGFTTGEAGRAGRLPGEHQQRPRLGGGLLPHGRLGGLRPHPGRNLPTAGALFDHPGLHQSVRRRPASAGQGPATPSPRPRTPARDGRDRRRDAGSREARSWLEQGHLAAVGRRALVVICGLAARPRPLAAQAAPPRDRGSSASRPLSGCSAPTSSTTGLPVDPRADPRGGAAGASETHVGLEPDLALVDRADAVLFGGRRAGAGRRRAGRGPPPRGREPPAQAPRLVRTGLTWYGMPRLPLEARRVTRFVPAAHSVAIRATDIQLPHDNQGPHQEEAAGVHARALQAVRHLQPFLPQGGHRRARRRHPVPRRARGLHVLRTVRGHVPRLGGVFGACPDPGEADEGHCLSRAVLRKVSWAKVIYLDHASTTPADPEVVAAMLPWHSEEFGNPSTVYSLGLTAAQRGAEGPRVDRPGHRRRARGDLLHQRRHRVRQLGHPGHGRGPAEEGAPPHHLHHRAPRGAREHGVPGEARLRDHPGAGGWRRPGRSRETCARPSGPTPSWSRSCTPTTRSAPSSPSPRSARSPARPGCSSTSTPCRRPASCRSTSTSWAWTCSR